jgi:hypothetical protein
MVTALALGGCTMEHDLGETASNSGASGSAGESDTPTDPTNPPDATDGPDDPSATGAFDESSGGGDTADADLCERTEEMLALGAANPLAGIEATHVVVLQGTCTVGTIMVGTSPDYQGLLAADVELTCLLEGSLDETPVDPGTPFDLTLDLLASEGLDLSVLAGDVGFRYAWWIDDFDGLVEERWLTLTPGEVTPGLEFLLDAMDAGSFDPTENNEVADALEAAGFGPWREILSYRLDPASCVTSQGECVGEEHAVQVELPVGGGGGPPVDQGRWERINWTDFGPFSRVYNLQSSTPNGECDGHMGRRIKVVTIYDGAV